MYEFEIVNRHTGEVYYIYGYDYADAWRRRPQMDRADWSLHCTTYID